MNANYLLPFRQELITKSKALYRRQQKGHPLAAIKLFCAECSGGMGEIPGCTDQGCFLYRYRMGHGPKSKHSLTTAKPHVKRAKKPRIAGGL